jgi:hypothetical protein
MRELGVTHPPSGQSTQILPHTTSTHPPPCLLILLHQDTFQPITTMSVLFQLKLFSSVAILSGVTLLTKPAVLLRSPLEPYLTCYTKLPSTTINPPDLTIAAIPIMAIGFIYACSIWSGDDKFVRISGTKYNYPPFARGSYSSLSLFAILCVRGGNPPVML